MAMAMAPDSAWTAPVGRFMDGAMRAPARRLLRLIVPIATALAMSAAGAAGAGDRPQRVVSMNLCTDQLALLLAEPGQVHSVSYWAAMPSASNLADRANRLRLNAGSAEDVFLMRPDLVLAGEFTNRAAVSLWQRLGGRVEVFPAAASLADIHMLIARMGRLLGREERAAALRDDFIARLDALARRAEPLPRDAGAYHYANNYTSGAGTLASDVMVAAGLDNAAAERGLLGTARLDLETLVMLEPFLIRTRHISGNEIGRSFENADHPALKVLAENGRAATIAERWQICGTPFVAEAISALIEARRAAPVRGENRMPGD